VTTAPLEIEFDYTRSLGPVLSEFMTGLRAGRILGARASDGRVHAPPFEYDPVTLAPPDELVTVGPDGTVIAWCWQPAPVTGQPLERPFGWALIRLDGADTALLHAVDAITVGSMHTGLRVRPRWAASRTGSIRDIECFEPGISMAVDESSTAIGGGRGDIVTAITTPVRLGYTHTAAPGEAAFLRGLARGKLIGQRCPACGQVYIPPRRSCPADGVPTTDEVELPDTGTVTTFCIVNFPYPGQRIDPPFVAASVLLDGADIAFQHLLLDCAPDDVRMGMRVRAVWKPEAEWGMSLQNISHFRPSGEPDAPYEAYRRHT
jgi:uncharacterized OB-fold protein